MDFTSNQIAVLNLLLDKYENSKTYNGTNIVKQNFYIEPARVWKEYTSDYADVSLVKDFENDMLYLENCELIKIIWKCNAIEKIFANDEKWQEYYALLKRVDKNSIIREQIEFYVKWKEKNIPIIELFCREQLERISIGKKTVYDINTANEILRIIDFLCHNAEEILERELSILLFSDSKTFEKEYRSRICKLLRQYKDFSDILAGVDDVRESEKIILEEYNIYSNPSYVYMKGHAHIEFENGDVLTLTSEPLAVSSRQLKSLKSIMVKDVNIITVENLTSFHRVKECDSFYIYLAGYHNTEKQLLLKKIYVDNECKNWYHFGDIDPDGFYILENLKSGTEIEFEPLYMGIDELVSFSKACRPLEKNDIVKAKNLIEVNKYADVLQYMLENNCKLEQEIVSLRL